MSRVTAVAAARDGAVHGDTATGDVTGSAAVAGPRRPSTDVEGPFTLRGVGRVAHYLSLAIAALVTLFPFYAMVVLSLHPHGAIEIPKSLLPWPITGEAYAQVLGSRSLGRWIINTVVYAGVSVVLVLLFASMAGYAFAKKRFRGRESLFWAFLAMLMVPYQITMIPTFILVAKSGGVDTYWGLILPTLANAQAVFLMRQFIAALPDELIDAARVDGCSEWRIYTSIVLPLTRPILATLGVFVFLWHWNDLLWPLVVGQDLSMRTLTTGIASLQVENVPLNVVMAGSVVAFLPIFLSYLWGQRYFTEGVATSGIKG